MLLLVLVLAIMACNRHLYRPNAQMTKAKINLKFARYHNRKCIEINRKINMAESVIKSYFPSQVASDSEKMSLDYGLSW